jgi:hypothetical protein
MYKFFRSVTEPLLGLFSTTATTNNNNSTSFICEHNNTQTQTEKKAFDLVEQAISFLF